jgi:hypothetical protein
MIPIVFSIFAAPMAASVMTSAAAGRFPFVAASENTLFTLALACALVCLSLAMMAAAFGERARHDD